ncbi:MAG: alpha/beta hydrolase [Myxococcales bacterium]|nr:alpha/beta hydrolase [Myxococcales bacterium]
MPSEAHESIVNLLRESGGIGLEPDGSLDVAAMREGMEAMTATAELPEGTRCTPCEVARRPAEWVEGPDADASRVLLYFHGGGYVIGSIATHRGLVARIARVAGIRGLVLDYRLAPEHPFPAAVEDATAAYRFLLEQGITPEGIAIGGDSAGGGLTFATLVALRDSGIPLPAAAIALSPWVDLEGTGESMSSKADADPMVGREGLLEMARLYLGEADPKTPTAAPLHADLAGLPPLYVQVGTAETLLDDATRIAERARAAGVQIELEPFEDLVHVFQAFAPHVPESLEAIEKLGAFLKRQL